MTIINYPCRGNADYNDIRQMWIENYNLIGKYYSRNVGEMDFCRFISDPGTLSNLQIWKDTLDNKTIGYVWWWENDSDYYLASHNNYRFIDGELLEFSEEKRKSLSEGEEEIYFYDSCYDYDKNKEEVLKKRGYEITEYYSSFCRRSLQEPIPKSNLPEGYYIRNIEGLDDVEDKALVTNSQKHKRNTTINNYTNLMKESQTYIKKLDLVLVDPNGNFTAYATYWLDKENKVGILEPLAVSPEYRGMGFGKNILYEGMRRLKALKSTDLYVLVEEPKETMPYSFYKSVGFIEDSRAWIWEKNLSKNVK